MVHETGAGSWTTHAATDEHDERYGGRVEPSRSQRSRYLLEQVSWLQKASAAKSTKPTRVPPSTNDAVVFAHSGSARAQLVTVRQARWTLVR